MKWRESFEDVATRGVQPKCIACGSEEIGLGSARVVLIAVSDAGQVAVTVDDAQATGIVCAPVICANCGFVSLYNLAAYEK